MSALYDQNLPPSLIVRLSDILPASEHVRNVSLAQADDRAVWDYARRLGYTIYSKDADFRNLALLRGHPPKSVRLVVGNASVAEIARFIRDRIDRIIEFEADPVESHLELK